VALRLEGEQHRLHKQNGAVEPRRLHLSTDYFAQPRVDSGYCGG
jgi:hypothetical protein